MSKLAKVALIAFMSGLMIVLVACMFGMIGIEPVASIILTIGVLTTLVGVFAGWVEFIRYIWTS